MRFGCRDRIRGDGDGQWVCGSSALQNMPQGSNLKCDRGQLLEYGIQVIMLGAEQEPEAANKLGIGGVRNWAESAGVAWDQSLCPRVSSGAVQRRLPRKG